MREIRETEKSDREWLPWIKLARFGDFKINNCLRNNENVLAVSGCEGDYDGEKVSFHEAVAIARKAGLLCIIYTSRSHTQAAPRWRVLVFFRAGNTPPAERHLYVMRLNGIFGGILADESFNLSQSFYYGKVTGVEEYRVELVEGEPLDLLDGLPEIGRPNGRVANGSVPNGGIKLTHQTQTA